ncbi:hypothetical protein B0H10DRAFT_2188484 [Mycena sp. CBHHK59/15]|nr:hypothetical protein B0H10DRAFT_2188484 [Mycena sp. CBHHK59/15]
MLSHQISPSLMVINCIYAQFSPLSRLKFVKKGLVDTFLDRLDKPACDLHMLMGWRASTLEVCLLYMRLCLLSPGSQTFPAPTLPSCSHPRPTPRSPRAVLPVDKPDQAELKKDGGRVPRLQQRQRQLRMEHRVCDTKVVLLRRWPAGVAPCTGRCAHTERALFV